MKKYEITYRVFGYHTEIIEVDDDVAIEEVEEMCYTNFPPIEEYDVQVEECVPYDEEDEDDDDEEAQAFFVD